MFLYVFCVWPGDLCVWTVLRRLGFDELELLSALGALVPARWALFACRIVALVFVVFWIGFG